MIHFDSEKDMEDMLSSDEQQLAELLGINEEGALFRQVTLGKYGICDLLYIVDHGDDFHGLEIHIIELKNTKIQSEHIHQCARYHTFFHKGKKAINKNISIFSHLIGLKTDWGCERTDIVFTAQLSEWIKVYEISVLLKGIKIEEVSGWRSGDSDPDINPILEMMESENGES